MCNVAKRIKRKQLDRDILEVHRDSSPPKPAVRNDNPKDFRVLRGSVVNEAVCAKKRPHVTLLERLKRLENYRSVTSFSVS
jgi:hypothetical protein